MKENFWKEFKKYPVWLGHLFFILYFFQAAKLYAVRGTLTDNSGFLFHLINNESFFTPAHRFSSAFVQLIPLLFIYLHSSLELIMLTYSASFAIIYYLIFIICTHALRNNSAGWLLILVLSAGVCDYFFWPQCELQQGLAVLILFGALLPRISTKNTAVFILINLCFGILFSFFHLLLIFPLLYIVGYELLSDKTRRSIYYLIPVAFCFIPFFLKPILFPLTGYEAGKVPGVSQIIEGFLHFSSLESTRQWARTITRDSLPTLVLLVFSLVLLWRSKKNLLAVFVAFSFIAFLVIINVSNPEGNSPFYNATYYMVLAFIASYAVTKEFIMGNYSVSNWILISFIMILFFRNIDEKNWYYGNRYKSEKALVSYLKKYPTQKFIMNENRFVWNHINFPWATAYETLMISALEGPEKTVTVYVNFPKDDNFISQIHSDEVVFNPWERLKANELNQRYFQLKDSAYLVLGNEEIDKLSDELP